MENFQKSSEQKTEKPPKLTREDVIKRLGKGENLENLVLTDLDLAGLNLEGKSFRGSDIRGLILYREDEEVRTNIKGADFTDAIIANLGPETFFVKIEAERAIFGFTENLIERRKRLNFPWAVPQVTETGGLYNFIGNGGNFRQSQWLNIDFGGGSDYEGDLYHADLSGALMQGCDLSKIDFSETKIDNLKIVDQVSLFGFTINKNQIEILVKAVQLTDPKKQKEFLKEMEVKGKQKALEDFFGIMIIEKD